MTAIERVSGLLTILLTGILHATEGFSRGKDRWRHRKHLAAIVGVFEFILGLILISEPVVHARLAYILGGLWALLVGAILAFVGAVQLKMFNAEIYVANLVGLGMVMEMGALMTGIILAGRTGASFAAQLGTMQVNEEIDALQTLGIAPMEFLVLRRMLALILMMPLLCIYADLMGILGGFIVGVAMLNISSTQYINQTIKAMNLYHFFIGIVHAIVFGVLVALAGCLRGIQCGRSASAVGQATTSAVVTSIVAIVIATAIITVACNILGI